MRIVIDEDIPSELTPLFGGPDLDVQHVTGDTNLGHQLNLAKYDLAIVLLHPGRLVLDQIKPLIPLAVAAFPTAPKHAVTTVGVARQPARKASSKQR